ncbi:MAG: hypothetical protein Q3988_03865 [Gemella sp.]|nr:hypothetical protein [Gemella sp.]
MNHKLSLFLVISNIVSLGLLIGSLVVEDLFVKKVLVLIALAIMIVQKIFDFRAQTEKSKKIFSAVILAFLVGAFGFFLTV